MAPVDGSGVWPAWMQMVPKRAFSRNLTGVHSSGLYQLMHYHQRQPFDRGLPAATTTRLVLIWAVHTTRPFDDQS